MIVGASWFGTNNLPTVTDTVGTTYTIKFSDVTHTEKVAVITGLAAGSGANTINVAITSGQFQNVNGVEMVGNPCDITTTDGTASSTFSGTPANVTLPSITTAFNSDCIYAGTGNDNSTGFQGIQDGDLGTWWQVGSMGGTDSGAGFLRIGGTAGAGNNLTVTNGATLGTTFNVAFKSNALAIQSPTAAPDGDTLTAYSYTVLATGGAGAYTWSVSSGALPTGLSINSSTGAITGTPTVSNNYTATIQVQDAGAVHTATKSMNFKIVTALNAITLVQSLGSSSSSASTSLIYSSNVTSGNLLLIDAGFGTQGAKVGYCTDTIGTPFKLLTLIPNRIIDPTNLYLISVIAGIAPSSAADTVTCNGLKIMAISEWSNANFIAADNAGFTRGSTASPVTVTSNSLTTLVPNELIFANCTGLTQTGTMTVQAPFTQIGTGFMFATGYRLVTTVTGYTESCAMAGNTANVWTFALIGLRPSGGTVVPPVTNTPAHSAIL